MTDLYAHYFSISQLRDGGAYLLSAAAFIVAAPKEGKESNNLSSPEGEQRDWATCARGEA